MFESINSERFLELYEYFEGLKKDSQVKKLDEEHGELQRAMYGFDEGFGCIEDVIQELADNFALLFQHMYARDIAPEEVYNKLLEKLDRTEKRKEDKYYEQRILL